jgi:hypothetical protein
MSYLSALALERQRGLETWFDPCRTKTVDFVVPVKVESATDLLFRFGIETKKEGVVARSA